MVPVCRTALQGGEVVRLRVEGAATLEVLLDAPEREGFGDLDGLPGSNCPVPVSFLRTQMAGQGGTTVRLLGVPPGRYRYLLGEISELVEVPGPPLDLRSR